MSTQTDPRPLATCCSAEAQDTCCDTAAKSDCCGAAATASGGCGCR